MGTLVKAKIQGLEGSKFELEVQFNPKELQVDKSVSWTPKSAHDEHPTQEFKEPQSSTLSCTLYFDGYETKKDVYSTYVSKLEQLVTMDEALGRPSLVVFAWGKFTFKGVVDSLSQKYTMFLEDGTRVRCEVGFKMRSAKAAEVSAKVSTVDTPGSTSRVTRAGRYPGAPASIS